MKSIGRRRPRVKARVPRVRVRKPAAAVVPVGVGTAATVGSGGQNSQQGNVGGQEQG